MASWGDLIAERAHLLWVDVEAPTDDELQQVSATLKLDPRAMEHMRQVNRRPVVHFYSDQIVLTAISVDLEEQPGSPRIHVVEVDLLLGVNFLVSLHKRPLPFAQELAERMDGNPHLGRFDAAYLLYITLDTLATDYAGELDELERNVERIEEKLLRDPGQQALREAMLVKRHAHNLRRLLAPHRHALSVLVSLDAPIEFEPAVQLAFRDLMAHLDSLVQRLDHMRDVITGSYSIYLGNISSRTNEQLKILTFLSAVLLPMTVVTGIFGTNFSVPEYDRLEAFYIMLVSMGIIALVMVLFFRSRRWM